MLLCFSQEVAVQPCEISKALLLQYVGCQDAVVCQERLGLVVVI